jgi:1-acyl-sn-glycerol-3-phosphate acyltransferase
MDDKIVIFEPEHPAMFKKSPLYGLAMFGRAFFLCSGYFARAVARLTDVAVTDDYIKMLWKSQFQNAHCALYVKGRQELGSGQTYIFMSNHESWLDIPAMFAAVPTSLRMVSKAGIMKIPIVGRAMDSAGFIAIDRNNRSRAIKQLELAKDRLKSGISIWMAPEGTRSRDGEIGLFKKGGFHLARSLGVPIVPVYIEGARNVMPADGLSVNTNRSITVHFCRPVETANLERADTDRLIEQVRAAILAKKEQVQNDNTDDGCAI